MILDQATYVQRAEKTITTLKNTKDMKGKVNLITTSQIRNLLAMVSDIYNEVLLMTEPKLTAELCGRLSYLKVRFIYEAGRDPKAMKSFVTTAKILEALDEIGTSKEKCILFYHYMEALVAYHKFYGGRD